MIWHRIFVGFLLLSAAGAQESDSGETCEDTTKINGDTLSQDQLVSILTDPCRYEKSARPNTTTPFDIKVRIDVNHLEAVQAQFTAYLSLQIVYVDKRLSYEKVSPKREIILGDESLKEKIWTPNIYLKDQDSTTVTGMEEKEHLISIDPKGGVTYTSRVIAKFTCFMNLQKFPFDTQKCDIAFGDWSYNSNNLNLSWSEESPLNVATDLSFTEFILDGFEYTEDKTTGPYSTKALTSKIGTFSELVIKFNFHRDIGYYMFDFFLPSYLLVFTAWVTFWLQADAGPPRATLGATTVVAFITLHLGVTKDIPKVAYIKASDIWFLGISCFIFLSLVEFAFVNVIWRRKKIIELRKPKPKHIIKAAVVPSVARKELRRYESNQTLSLSRSTSDLNMSTGNFKSVESNCQTAISVPEDVNIEFSYTTMTPQEVAIWVDRKARIIFPIMFLVFNILYWSFVTCL